MASTIKVNTLDTQTGTELALAATKKITGDNTQFKITGGSNTNVLTTDGSGGLTWGAAAAGGKVLQFVAISDNTEYATATGTTVTAVQGTAADLVITPAAATSRILVCYSWGAITSYDSASLGYGKIQYDIGGAGFNPTLPVGSNTVVTSYMQFALNLETASHQVLNVNYSFIHHPNTGSEVTYRPYCWTENAGGYTYINRSPRDGANDYSAVMFAYALEIGA
jgi:hypothetical protein